MALPAAEPIAVDLHVPAVPASPVKRVAREEVSCAVVNENPTENRKRKIVGYTEVSKETGLPCDVEALHFYNHLLAITQRPSLTPSQGYTRERDGLFVKQFKCDLNRTMGCQARYKYEHDRQLGNATYYQNGTHDHSKRLKEATGMTPPQKAYVNNLLQGFARPLRVHLLLQEAIKQVEENGRVSDLAPLPDIKQIQNYSRNHGHTLRAKGFNSTLNGFKTFAAKHPLMLDSPETIACLAQEIDVKAKAFRFLFSSPAHLKLWMEARQRCVDGTYKLTWAGYPTIVVGFVDKAQRFHLCAAAVTFAEKDADFEWVLTKLEEACVAVDPTYADTRAGRTVTTMQDGADAIRNGEDLAYGPLFEQMVQLMCWSHFMRAFEKNIKTKVSKTDEEEKAKVVTELKDDVRAMHYVPYPFAEAFAYVAKVLFPSKWNDRGEATVVTYFLKTWTGRCIKW